VEARSPGPRGEILGGEKGQERRGLRSPGNTGPCGTDLLGASIPEAAMVATCVLRDVSYNRKTARGAGALKGVAATRRGKPLKA